MIWTGSDKGKKSFRLKLIDVREQRGVPCARAVEARRRGAARVKSILETLAGEGEDVCERRRRG